MPTIPANPYSGTAKRARRFVVLLGEPDELPTLEDETRVFEVLSITRASGGDKKDVCEIVCDLGYSGQSLIDMTTPASYSRKIEVRLVPDTGDVANGKIMFWGELGVQGIVLSDGRSEATMRATVENFHFGDILVGPEVFDPIDDESRVLARPVVFNPEIDGIVEPNRSGFRYEDDPDQITYVWVDPESLRTSAARLVQAIEVDVELEAESWTLGQATVALCWLLNRDETYVINPTLTELDNTGVSVPGEAAVYGDAGFAAAGIMVDAPPLKDVKMTVGRYLPQLLTELLHPHGFDWYAEPVRERNSDALEDEEDTADNTTTKLKLRFFERNVGVEREVYLARPGNRADSSNNNAAGVGIEWGLMELANVVVAQGSTIERECTFELFRGWDEDDDALEADDLRKTDETATTVFATKPNVWRKWVLDTAGDYGGLRDTVDVARPWLTNADTPFDLKPILGDDTIPRRRKFGAPLTYKNADKERFTAASQVEWFDPDDDTDDPAGTWKHISGFSILEKECGVYWDGDSPPDKLMELGDDARIRITATVKGDTRVEGEATRRATSPLGSDVKLYLDVSDRFHDRQVQTAGDYLSVLYPGTYDADEHDDATAIQTYAEDLRNVEEAARIRASLVIAGIEPGYSLGELITQIQGRNISLNQNSPDNATKRYLQITEIQYDPKAQTTRLNVETFDDVTAKKLVV